MSNTRLPSIDPSRFDKWRVFELMGYIPDEWQALFHESRAKNRLLACGTRVGKTYCLTPEVVAATVCPSPLSIERGEWVGSRVWVAGPTYNLADKLFLPAARALKQHFPWLITSYRLNDGIVRTLGDGFLERKSTENANSLVGEQLDAVVGDEASRIGEFEKEQLKQRLANRNGWAAWLSSPVPSRWFQREFERGQRNGVSYRFVGDAAKGYKYAGKQVVFDDHTVTNGFDSSDNFREYWSCRVPTHANMGEEQGRISLEWLKDQERTSPERIFRQDILAEFMAAEGAVFANVDSRVGGVPLSRGKPGHRYAIAWDVARARDFSVLTAFDYVTGAQVALDRFQGPWDMQYDRVERFCRRFHFDPTPRDGKPPLPGCEASLVIDATGPGDAPAAEMERRNYRARFCARIERLVISSNAKKRELVETYAGALDQGEVTLLNDPVQIQEHRLYEFRQSEATGMVRYSAPPGFHDDTVMADAMAVHLLKRPMGTATCFFG